MKTIDINGPVASRKINEHVDIAIQHMLARRHELKAKKGELELTVSFQTRYLKPLQAIPQEMGAVGNEEMIRFREIVFTLTARIK